MEINKLQPSNEIAMGKVTSATPVRPQIENERVETPDNESLETAYSYDKEANVFVAKFLDKTKQGEAQVVKQYPPEEMLAIARQIGKLQGNVIDIKA